MDQRDVVERAGRGDHDAFALLVDASIARLEAVAYLIIHDHELARDAVQDAYIRAWRDLPGLREPDRFDAWLHRLTVNACLDAIRKRRRRPIEVDIEPISPQVSGDEIASIADRDTIQRGLDRLRPEQRAILVLHYYLGLSTSAIGETLGIPQGTAQSRLHAALSAMRAALAAVERAPGAIQGRVVA